MAGGNYRLFKDVSDSIYYALSSDLTRSNGMDWDAIGAVAEMIGAVAVVVTLIYLAIQTRDNVKVLRARAVWDAQVSFVEVNEILGDGGTVSELIYRTVNDPDKLSAYEEYLVHRFMRGWFQRMEAQFALYRAGILEREVWQLRRGYAKAILQNPVISRFWEMDKNNSMFTKAFVESIDSTKQTQFPGFMGIDTTNVE
jgi:hypothetical protein